MTDFYALLKQSILDRGIRDADDREAVYAQARQAIVKQLWAFRPPLAADEIDTRVGAYDEAVERIERDVRAVFARDATPARTMRAAPLAAVPEPDDDDIVPEDEPAEDDAEMSAPPLAAWRHGEGADDEETIEPADAAPAYDDLDEEIGEDDVQAWDTGGVQRAPLNGRRRLAFPDEPANREEENGRGWLQRQWDRWPGARHAGNGADLAAGKRHHERWNENGEIETVGRSWWPPALGEREAIRILGGAIAALVIALVVFGTVLFFSRGGGEEVAGGEGVTLDIGVRREVSDAATAARIPNDPLEVVQSYTLFDGRDPTIFATTPDNPIRYFSDGGYTRVSSSTSSPGVRAVIGPGLADRLAGQRIRVTIVARSSTDFGAGSMRFAYQSGLAISHWQTANLAAGYEAVGMLWRVPAMRTDPGGDYLVIEPGIPGDGTGVDIQSIEIDVLAREDS